MSKTIVGNFIGHFVLIGSLLVTGCAQKEDNNTAKVNTNVESENVRAPKIEPVLSVKLSDSMKRSVETYAEQFPREFSIYRKYVRRDNANIVYYETPKQPILSTTDCQKTVSAVRLGNGFDGILHGRRWVELIEVKKKEYALRIDPKIGGFPYTSLTKDEKIFELNSRIATFTSLDMASTKVVRSSRDDLCPCLGVLTRSIVDLEPLGVIGGAVFSNNKNLRLYVCHAGDKAENAETSSWITWRPHHEK